MKYLLILVVCLCLGFGWTPADEAKKETAAETRARYAKQSAEVLKIAEPVEVSKVYYWKDGGSIGIELTDAKKAKHLFCLDGRMLPSKDRPNDKEVGTRNLFIGATYPTGKEAKKVELRGPEESALYGVMLRWANKHPKRATLFDASIDLNRKEDGNLWEIRAFLLKLDARFTQK